MLSKTVLLCGACSTSAAFVQPPPMQQFAANAPASTAAAASPLFGARSSRTAFATMQATAELSDAEKRAQEAMKAADAADSGSTDGAGFTNINTAGPATYPLAGVVGQEAIKTALLLCGVNPKIGGVVISGSRGTAKSVMARAVHKLLPPIERIKGSEFNIDPASPKELDSFLANELATSGKTVADLETEVIPTPFVQVRAPPRARAAFAPHSHRNTRSLTNAMHRRVHLLWNCPCTGPYGTHPRCARVPMQVPLDVLEDRLLGAVDVQKSVTTGVTVFEPGLLAKAHRGVL